VIILIIFGEEYNYEAPRYTVSSTLLSFLPPSAQMSSSMPSSQTSSVYMSHSISVPPGFPGPFLMAYSGEKLKSNDDKASPYFRPSCIGKSSEKCVPVQNLLHVSFKHILINLTSFMGTLNSMRILYKTSLFIES
jgi:hypothetical protein